MGEIALSATVSMCISHHVLPQITFVVLGELEYAGCVILPAMFSLLGKLLTCSSLSLTMASQPTSPDACIEGVLVSMTMSKC